MGAELYRADGRTDGHDDLNLAFRNFAKARNKGWRIYWHVCLAVSPNENIVRRSKINHANFCGACERGNLKCTILEFDVVRDLKNMKFL
jgi:hypothetical protein